MVAVPRAPGIRRIAWETERLVVKYTDQITTGQYHRVTVNYLGTISPPDHMDGPVSDRDLYTPHGRMLPEERGDGEVIIVFLSLPD